METPLPLPWITPLCSNRAVVSSPSSRESSSTRTYVCTRRRLSVCPCVAVGSVIVLSSPLGVEALGDAGADCEYMVGKAKENKKRGLLLDTRNKHGCSNARRPSSNQVPGSYGQTTTRALRGLALVGGHLMLVAYLHPPTVRSTFYSHPRAVHLTFCLSAVSRWAEQRSGDQARYFSFGLPPLAPTLKVVLTSHLL